MDLAFKVLGLLWLLSIPRHPAMLFFAMGPLPWIMSRADVGLAPVWHAFYWVLIGLNVLQLTLSLIALNRSAQPWRAAMKMVERCFGFAFLLFLLQVKEYLVFLHPVADAERVKLVATINQDAHLGLTVVAVIIGLKLLWDLGQILMRSRQPGAVAHIMA